MEYSYRSFERLPFNAYASRGTKRFQAGWRHRIKPDFRTPNVCGYRLFTDATYGSINFNLIENYLKNNFNYVDGEFGGNPGMGKSYLIGQDNADAVKIDIYYSMDPFFQTTHFEERVRMATVEEIVAMKVDTIQRGGRKKDFWDLHKLLEQYSINKMIALHRQRFEWTHNEPLIRKNFIDFSSADYDLDPICLKNKQWEFIKDDIEDAMNKA